MASGIIARVNVMFWFRFRLWGLFLLVVDMDVLCIHMGMLVLQLRDVHFDMGTGS